MKILRKLRNDNIDDFIDPILDEFDVKIKDYKKDLNLSKKNIKNANIEQASLLAYYDEIRVDLKMLLEHYEMRVKQVRSEALKLIRNHGSYDKTSTEVEKIIDSDANYLKYKRIYNDVLEMYTLLTSISDQFKSRAYTLNNLVKIYAAQLEDITLE